MRDLHSSITCHVYREAWKKKKKTNLLPWKSSHLEPPWQKHKGKGIRAPPWHRPLVLVKKPLWVPFTNTENRTMDIQNATQFCHLSPKPHCLKKNTRENPTLHDHMLFLSLTFITLLEYPSFNIYAFICSVDKI